VTEPDLRREDLLTLLRRQSNRLGDRPFMTFADGAAMSFRQFERRVAGFRAWLTEAGARPGDRVALLLKNSLFYPVAWFGVATAGAVAAPMNSRLGEARRDHRPEAPPLS